MVPMVCGRLTCEKRMANSLYGLLYVVHNVKNIWQRKCIYMAPEQGLSARKLLIGRQWTTRNVTQLTCQMLPSPAWVIFSVEKMLLFSVVPPVPAPPLAPPFWWLLLPLPDPVAAAAAAAAAVPATVATVGATVVVVPAVAGSALRAGGVWSSTYSLNITEGRRLVEVGGLRKPEVHG